MKTEFKAKFLQHINQKNREEGFTLIELLVVVIIIGILAAVALPSLLSQTNKAKQVEARNNIGAMNRAQQAVFLERNGFATDMANLGVGIQTQTTNYEYSMVAAGGTLPSSVNNQAKTRVNSLKPYAGLVWSVTDPTTSQATTRAILCEEADPKPPNTAPTVAAAPGVGATCGAMKTLE
ncbi:type IV pilin-like G/H family protein [Oscillatoria sp. HE19RPO]|uniref:type IV pilin-like G/H family protein n=1 Tax=Oscillatoria sp. HE19RPO TaxID=2954806 RepID=UPI0020C498A4|nr:type IV pilin-like G/H family protein [Oscillatoria sp. HE19RPO]